MKINIFSLLLRLAAGTSLIVAGPVLANADQAPVKGADQAPATSTPPAPQAQPVPAQPAVATPGQPPVMLPDRLLTCSIGHIINFDPHRIQTPNDLKFDGMHVFNMFLPSIPLLKGTPPDAAEEAPPVDPRTRILDDPDHISGQPSNLFGRIIDLWPDRVEMSSVVKGPLLNLIVLNPIDADHGVASMFMIRASELNHYEADHIYQGMCHVVTGEAARNAVKAMP